MGNLTTPKRVQKLQMALHAKAKAEAGYRFYALYDKISRDDILAHAYAHLERNMRGVPTDYAIRTYCRWRPPSQVADAIRPTVCVGRWSGVSLSSARCVRTPL